MKKVKRKSNLWFLEKISIVFITICYMCSMLGTYLFMKFNILTASVYYTYLTVCTVLLLYLYYLLNKLSKWVIITSDKFRIKTLRTLREKV